MINTNDEYDSKVHKEFQDALDKDASVDELISILKKNYLFVPKYELSCKDCFNCEDNTGQSFITNIPYYCRYYQRPLNHLHLTANDCDHYLSGGFEAKKSIAKLHYELTGE